MGRGVAVNGNRRAVLPPASPTPMRRYRMPEPPRRTGLRLLGRLLWLALAVLVMVGSALAGGAYLFFDRSVSEVTSVTPELRVAAKQLAVPLPHRPAIALVVGYDRRSGPEADLESRSDTIMLLRADPETDSVSMLSFPRDLLAPLYCPPGRPVGYGKINGAYSVCGSKGTLETVKRLTGLPINYLITVDFRGFRQIVDKLGGVWIDVDRRYFNDNGGRTYGTYATIDLQPGYQKLNGSDALDYVRFRHADSDIYRLARQQAFVKGIKEQVSHSFKASSILRVVRAITKNVDVVQGGGRAPSGRTIAGYGLFVFGLPSGHFFQPKIRGLEGQNDLTTAPENLSAAVRDFTTPDVEAPRAATAAAEGRRLRARGPRPQDVTVTVLNGNGVTGSASNAAFELRQRGYRTLPPPGDRLANAPSYDYVSTKVLYRTSVRGSKAAARRIAGLIGDADIGPMPSGRIRQLSNGAMIVTIVGQTFHGSLAPAAVDQTPKHEAPNVVSNPEASLPLLRPLRRRVPFRLELPTVLDRTSTPASEDVPVRLYGLPGGHQAVRLTYRTGVDFAGYWGIEQTDWADAPALANPNLRRVVNGRRFDLYYSGFRLHMVVLREYGAIYWVVNTLLDDLSNETMLAIAKGLRPLPK